MRHGKKFNHLSRTASHRKALLANLAKALIKHKRIRTTLAKAKALRKYVEPIINRAKYDTMHSRRMVFSYLQDKHSVKELYSNIREKIYERPGGYTRILKLGPRSGDFAEMAFIELVDFNEFIEDKTKSLSSRARKRSKKAKAPVAKDTNVTQEITLQEPVTERSSSIGTIASDEQQNILPDSISVDNENRVAEAETADEVTPDSDNKS
jgi:large subunit ribosomal protein L17